MWVKSKILIPLPSVPRPYIEKLEPIRKKLFNDMELPK
jgi:hypothetical protein